MNLMLIQEFLGKADGALGMTLVTDLQASTSAHRWLPS